MILAPGDELEFAILKVGVFAPARAPNKVLDDVRVTFEGLDGLVIAERVHLEMVRSALRKGEDAVSERKVPGSPDGVAGVNGRGSFGWCGQAGVECVVGSAS
jgi:hypothetical protein